MKILIASLVFGWIAHAHAGSADQTSSSLLALTSVFPRAIKVFHYAPRADVGLAETGAIDSADNQVQNAARQYRLQTIATYSDLSLANNNQGFNGALMGPNGLYTAIDPQVSRRWGGERWSLQEMTIPAATRYVDGRNRRPFAPEILAWLKPFNCNATQTEQLIESAHLGCMQALRELTRVTGARVVAYWYLYNQLPVCVKTAGTYATAFIVIDAKGIDQDSVAVFAREAPTPDAVALERQHIADFYHAVGARSDEFASVKISKDSDGVNRWAVENLYRCHPQVRE